VESATRNASNLFRSRAALHFSSRSCQYLSFGVFIIVPPRLKGFSTIRCAGAAITKKINIFP